MWQEIEVKVLRKCVFCLHVFCSEQCLLCLRWTCDTAYEPGKYKNTTSEYRNIYCSWFVVTSPSDKVSIDAAA